MLTFADSAWHIFTNTIIFLAGLSIAIAQRRVFKIPHRRAVVLYLWHTFFCLSYFWYSLDNPADAKRYYLYSLNYVDGFNFGTDGITFLVSPFTQLFQLSYGGAFLLFNIIGYIGMLALASALRTVTVNSSRTIKKLSILVLFIPGLSFWSAAIGKDAVTFMGAGIATWAALDIRRRASALAFSAFLFLVPRPHMAGILLVSIAFAMLVSSQTGIYKKVFILALSVPVSILAVQFGLQYAGLGDVSGMNDVADYFDQRQDYNLEGGSSVDISGMSVPLRLLTYLFRPLFFDANGILGLFVSFENLFLLLIFSAATFKLKSTRSTLERFEITFFLLFSVASWFVLANTTANVGIAIRQKWMFLPMLLVLAFSYLSRRPGKVPMGNNPK